MGVEAISYRVSEVLNSGPDVGSLFPVLDRAERNPNRRCYAAVGLRVFRDHPSRRFALYVGQCRRGVYISICFMHHGAVL
jgi:hypothetical protein